MRNSLLMPESWPDYWSWRPQWFCSASVLDSLFRTLKLFRLLRTSYVALWSAQCDRHRASHSQSFRLSKYCWQQTKVHSRHQSRSPIITCENFCGLLRQCNPNPCDLWSRQQQWWLDLWATRALACLPPSWVHPLRRVLQVHRGQVHYPNGLETEHRLPCYFSHWTI